MAESAAEKIVLDLASSDPVYGPVRYQPPGSTLPGSTIKAESRRFCALCHAMGEHQAENVQHRPGCLWIEARRFAAAAKDR